MLKLNVFYVILHMINKGKVMLVVNPRLCCDL